MTVGQRDKNTGRNKEPKRQKEANKNAFTQLLTDVENADYNDLRSHNLSGYAAYYLRKVS